jgi:hypothetical protein
LLVEYFDDITDDVEEFSASDFFITCCHSFREYTQIFQKFPSQFLAMVEKCQFLASV